MKPATRKQIAWLIQLGGKPYAGMTSAAASAAIEKLRDKPKC
jgi:hypothetical protein